jgi:hypothetical protein
MLSVPAISYYKQWAKVCLLVLCCFVSFSSQAQTRSFFFDIKGPAAKGTILWQDGNYKEAAPYLEQALAGRKGKNNKQSLRKKLAYAYAHIGNAKAAATIYTSLSEEGVSLGKEHQLLYANSLMAAGQLEEGGRRLLAYLQDTGLKEQAKELEQKLSGVSLFQDTIRYNVENVSFNTSGSEFSPYLASSGIIFVSDKPRTGLIKHRFAADNTYGFDIFYGKFGRDEQIHSISRLSSPVNTPLPEGPVVLSQNGKKLIFTRATEGGGMKLFEAKVAFNLGSWVNVAPLEIPITGAVAHPAVADEGRVIYFVSEQPGGFGGMDIYQVIQEPEGWSEPQNLGPKINTAGNELFPTFSPDGKLRFSSNGQFGLGGLDIYEATLSQDSVVEVRNMGAPVNSASDDFGLSFHESGDWGYFSSNRSGGVGEDDIYRLQVNVIKLAGRVYDKTNRKGIGEVKVQLFKQGELLEETLSSSAGYYSFKVYPGQEYELTFMAPEFREHKEAFSTGHGPRYGTRKLDSGLDRKVKMFVLGTIRNSSRQKATGATLFAIDQQSGHIDTVFTGERGDYELELDVSSRYTFLAECDEENAINIFETPEKGKASLSYYEHLYMRPASPYVLKGQVKAPADKAGPYILSVTNRLNLQQETILTDEQGTFSLEAHPLADYEICLLQGSGASVQLKGGWSKPERRLELVY